MEVFGMTKGTEMEVDLFLVFLFCFVVFLWRICLKLYLLFLFTNRNLEDHTGWEIYYVTYSTDSHTIRCIFYHIT